jgi:hypothetical protein
MQYNPKLKIAMEEIKAIMKKYDCGGIVVLHLPGHSEYLFKIDPSYSCARFENGRVRINVKAMHYDNDKKLRDHFVTNTSNMFSLLSEVGGRLVLNLMDVSKTLDNAVQAEHTDGGHSSHTEQNN